jgi:class 3 adenylate cyclase/tetratricopeptide (TPR) repeat protein
VVEERKLATVIFADVVGFTSLAERTDAEVVARMVDAAFRRMGEVVTEHAGTVDKYMGDSVMAVFGVPVAHDDDAERAVAAGLAMRELGGDLAFSIGLNSGEVIVATVGRTSDVTVIGDTVNVAARLEKAAAPGEVLCGRLTAELAGQRVVFRERQPVPLKGKREPVEVWEAVAPRPAGAEAADGPPLVGRHDELAFLEAQWRRVCRERQTHVVLLCGEAGSGKTRLADELARVAEGDGTVVRAMYPAYGTPGGARVAAEVIRQLGPVEDDDVNARVRSIAGEVDPSLRSIDPSGIQQEQLWAFGRLLHTKSAEEPLLIVIDDMHRSGDRTLELLGELAGRSSGVALLAVLVGRTEPGAWLTRFPAATTVRLLPLSRSDATALAGAFVSDKPLAPETAEFLVDRASGNPLYLRELVAMARGRGELVHAADGYQLEVDGPVPPTLRALLAARLDALEPGQKLVLEHLAVLGEAATIDEIGGLGSPQPAPVLRSLLDSGLLQRLPDGRYDAVDPLLSEVAYETLPRSMRGELHRLAADVMSRPEERARHLDRAAGYLADDQAVAEEAAEALALAGQASIEASRHYEALRLFERATALGCRRPSVLLAYASVQAMFGQEKGAVQTLDMIPDDPSDPEMVVERDHTAARAMMFTDPAWALPRLQKAAERWRALGNRVKEAWAYANAGVASFYLSRMEESAANLERGLELFEQVGDRAGAVSASSVLCLARPTDRRVPGWLAAALEFAEAAGDRQRQVTTLTTLAWHHFFRSFCGSAQDMAEAEGFARRLAELAGELGTGELAVQGWSLLAIMARFSGRLDEAAAHVTALSRQASWLHDKDPWLGWAASFSVTVAFGAPGATPPFPPDTSPDPVVGMAGLLIEAELTMAGRIDEALSRLESAERPNLGPIADLVGVMDALALVLGGRAVDARPWAERAAGAARVLQAPAAATAADALLAEIAVDTNGLPPAPAVAASLTDALVLRAHVVSGDRAAADALRQATSALAMPGLLTAL